MVDVVLTGGQIVDGTGGAPQSGDLGIEGGAIAAVGDLRHVPAAERIDCAGRVVAPGFIDVHTHYDAQILWDLALTPSSWCGVTTVVMGNCGFTVAPTRPSDRADVLVTLEAVESMPAAVLDAGIDWTFETFPQYLDALRERPLALNVAAMVGHTMLRTYTEDLAQMQAELDTALGAGAFGLSTSRSPTHVAQGKPVASRMAPVSEIGALGQVLRSAGRGVVQANKGPDLGVAELGALATRIDRPVTWTSLHSTPDTDRARQLLGATAAAQHEGIPLWPQMSCVPITVEFNLAHPYILLEQVSAFGDLSRLEMGERRAAMRDPAWRRRAQREMTPGSGANTTFAWDRIEVLSSASAPELDGRSIAGIAADRECRPFEALVDVALADDLATRFTFAVAEYDEDLTAEFLVDPAVILGLSDAGAHASQMCGASFGPHLLGHWVRDRGALSLEDAVWKLTGQPADALRLRGRGVLREGLAADICVFDPSSIGHGPTRRVFDQPGGGDRLLRDVSGIDHVFVNGRALVRDGAPASNPAAGRLLPAPA
jgi:N-acyl-D-amino-acid deacylase